MQGFSLTLFNIYLAEEDLKKVVEGGGWIGKDLDVSVY